MISRWPDIWDDDEFTNLPITRASNNLDVYETDSEVVIKANVAGIPNDKIDVTFEKGILWISAKTETKEEDKSKKYYSSSSWDYSYKVAVPGLIDMNQEPSAEIENGVVIVTFKKAEASKPRKLAVKNK
jgi:HSP20 family protein